MGTRFHRIGRKCKLKTCTHKTQHVEKRAATKEAVGIYGTGRGGDGGKYTLRGGDHAHFNVRPQSGAAVMQDSRGADRYSFHP